MDNVWQRQTQMIDRSGLGLLPGIALAFVIALFLIAAIALHTWWAVAIGLIGALGCALAVVVIVMKTVLSEEDDRE
jgi:uncharacterized integral membrane protein